MTNLSTLIIQKIKDEGPIPFKDYMEMCLYYPKLGYYTSTRNKIGKNGDFYTSASVGAIFGAMIGRKLEKMWEALGNTPFTIVEYGAGTGRLCRDILTYLQHNKNMYADLRYCIIEKSPVMREIEKELLTEKVEWIDSISDISGIQGCVLSNELLDNFSVHLVVMEAELKEVFVTCDEDFKEVLQPASKDLIQYFEELDIKLPMGFRTEINLQALNWMNEVGAALSRGYVMTIDYGHLSSELYKSCRSAGTLICYRKHTVNDHLYEHIGEQDITAHVNFSALLHWGSKFGLNTCSLTSQGYFLMEMGFNQYLEQSLSHEQDVIKAAQHAAFLSRTLLYDMGSKYKVLIQEKGMNGAKS